METCTRCGADTGLYYHNVPICLRCSDVLEREIQQWDLQIPKNQFPWYGGTYREDLKSIGPALVIGVGQVQGVADDLKRSG
jgi:hypothetical protein